MSRPTETQSKPVAQQTTDDLTFEVLPDDAAKSAVQKGTYYWAKVNNTTDYGVFISLNNVGSSSRDEVNGLIHTSKLRIYDPDEFVPFNDEVVVELAERKDGGSKLDFRLIRWLTEDGDVQIEIDETAASGADAGPAAPPAGMARLDTALDDTDADADTDADTTADPAAESESESDPVAAAGHAQSAPADESGVEGETDVSAAGSEVAVGGGVALADGGVGRAEFRREAAEIADDLAVAPEGSELFFVAKGRERQLRRFVTVGGVSEDVLTPLDSTDS